MRVKVRFVNAPAGTGIERLEPEAAKAFAVTLRQRLMKVAPPKAGGARKVPAAASRPAGVPVGDSRGRENSTDAPVPSSAPSGSPPGDLSLDDIPF
jgi:hypothetical protein